MPSKPIRLSDHLGRTFDASELLPVDIVEETAQMDSLSGRSFKQYPEPISDAPSQDELLALCENVRSRILSGKRCEEDIEILSAHGFKMSGINEIMDQAHQHTPKPLSKL